MSLKGEIAADAVRLFCNPSEFAEPVTYYPHRHVGEDARPPRVINAIVVREQIATLNEDVETVAPVFSVHVANDATDGIGSSEIDTGGDQIEFSMRDGKPPKRWTITRVDEQDHGMMVLECR